MISTWLNDLSIVQKVLDGFDGKEITDYAKAIQGLNKKQAQLLLSVKGLSAEKQKEILVNAGLLASEEHISLGLVKESLAQTELNDEQKEAVLIKLGLIDENTKEAITQAACTKEDIEALVAQGLLNHEQAEGILKALGLGSSNAGLALSFEVLAKSIWKSIVAMAKWLVTTPAGAATLIASVVAGTIGIILAIEKAQQKAIEAGKEAKETIKALNNEFKNTKDTVEEVSSKYAKLAQGVDLSTNKNINLSTEEYNEFLDLSNQLSEVFPTLTKEYDENGNAILNLSGNISTITSELNNLLEVERKLKNQQILEELGKVYKGTSLQADRYQSQINFAKNDREDLLNYTLEKVTTNTGGKYNYQINSKNGMTSDLQKLFYEVIRESGGTIYTSETGSFGTTISFKLDGELDTTKLESKLKGLNESISEYTTKMENELSSLNQYLNIWLSEEYSYLNQDSEMQTVIKELLHNSDWRSLLTEDNGFTGDENNWEDVSEWLSKTFIKSIGDLDEESKANILDLFATDIDPKEKLQLAQELQDYFTENKIPINLSFILDEDKNGSTANVVSRFNAANDKLDDSNKQLESFFKEQGINTEEEYEQWIKLANGCYYASTAMQKWLKLQKEANNTSISFVEQMEQVNSLSEGLDTLADIYNDVRDGDDFDYSSIFNDDFKDTFGNYSDEYNNFIETISNSPQDIEKCQSAFDNLATAYIRNKINLGELTEETKTSTIAFLEQKGIINATEIVTNELNAKNKALALQEEALKIATENSGQALKSKMQALLDEANASQLARSYLFQLISSETVFNNSKLDTSQKVAQLKELAKAYGDTAAAKWLSEQVENRDIHSFGSDDLLKLYEGITSHMGQDVVSLAPSDTKTEKEAEKATEILDKYFNYYEKQLQAGQITYQEYIQKCNDIREEFYRDGKITSEEYYQYLADLYEKQLEYRDKAISAVVDLIDDKIKGLDKDKEKLEDYYNGLIEKIQSEIDELQKSNDERERAIALQKAQYELNRAINQRIDYRYKDGQFVYAAKDSAIRDAQNELDDQLFDLQINNLEKQIEDLEKALEDATETIDDQINALNEYKDKWSEIADVYEETQNRIYAESILGAKWEDEILAGRLDTWEKFKDEYLRIQQEMANATVLASTPTTSGGGSGGNSNGDKSGKSNKDTTEDTGNNQTKTTKVLVGTGWSDPGQATSKISGYNGNGIEQGSDGKWYVYKIQKYAKGGVVGNDKSPLDSIAHSLNEDHMVAVKTGERILTPIQNSNFEKLINVSADFVKLMKPFENIMKTPDFTKYVKNGNTKNDVVMNVSVNCPNVTNESGFNYITKELTSLTTKALQFDWNA